MSSKKPGWRFVDWLALPVLVGLVVLAAGLAFGGSRVAVVNEQTALPFAPAHGFYQPEENPAEQLHYRWTDGDGRLLLPNPGGRLSLELRLLDGPGPDQQLELGIGAEQHAFELLPGVRRYYLLAGPQPGVQFELHLRAPAIEINDRLLGPGVSRVTVGGSGATPPPILALSGLAALALYGLLRRAGSAPVQAGGPALVLALAVPLLYGAGGWRYGLFDEALTALAGIALAALAHEALPGRATVRGLLGYGLGLLAMTVALGLLLGLLLPSFVPPLFGGAAALAALGGLALLRQAGYGLPATSGLVVAGLVVLLAVPPLFDHALEQLIALCGLAGAAALAAPLIERWRPQPAKPGPVLALRRSDLPAVALLLGAALLVRLPWLAAADPVGDLELAAQRMSYLLARGLDGSYEPPGDYMPLRLYLLSGLARLAAALGDPPAGPLTPLITVVIKLPQLAADLLIPLVILAWAKNWLAPRRAALLAALYALSPPVWINVAWWGQVDALLMLPMLLAVVLIERAGGRWSWLCWTAALLIKPQAIILAPLIYLATLRRHGCRGLVEGGGLAIALTALVILPLALAGQLGKMIIAYTGSVGRFPRATNGAYNLWYLLVGPERRDNELVLAGLSAGRLGFLLLGAATALICWLLLMRSDGPGRARGAALLALAFFCLPTQIHERYLFLSLAFLALCVASRERWTWLYLWFVTAATLNVLAELSGFIPLVDATLGRSPLRYLIAAGNLAMLGLAFWWTARERQDVNH